MKTLDSRVADLERRLPAELVRIEIDGKAFHLTPDAIRGIFEQCAERCRGLPSEDEQFGVVREPGVMPPVD